jgi:hypothetical protein
MVQFVKLNIVVLFVIVAHILAIELEDIIVQEPVFSAVVDIFVS